MAKLFWLQPDNSIVEFPLKAEQSLIGRSSRCDVRIKHPGISAEHAVIRQLSGAATVEDLGSTNGTRVNGKKLQQMHTLRHGDQIGVGRERLMYFAELDSAAHFLQPESITPYALPAPVVERVNTEPDAAALKATRPPDTPRISPVAVPAARATSAGGPVIDDALVAALPKGASLAGAGAPAPPPRVANTDPTERVAPAVAAAAATRPVQALAASVAVLSGPAVGKRYPLTQASVTLGKEGKQVIEFVRPGPMHWQIRQREGVTPAYVNGDALAGVRDLVAGDVIELTGVRLRFEISLAPN